VLGAAGGLAWSLAVSLSAGPATAQEFTFAGKQVEIVVPFAPGGATEVTARFLAPFLERHLPGKPRVNVVTRPGGSSILGANWVEQNAKPDGLIFLFTTSSTSHPFLFGQKGVQYDLLKKRIGFSQSFGPVAYVSPDTGVKSPKDLLKPAKPLAYGGIGAAASDLPIILSFEVLKLQTKVALGFTGRGPIRIAFERGDTNFDFQFTPVYLTQVVPAVQAGKAIPLYTGGSADEKGNFTKRDLVVQDLPSLYEAHQAIYGKPPSGVEWDAYQKAATLTYQYGLTAFLHGDTPQPILNAYYRAVDAMNADPAFKAEGKKVTGGYPLIRGDVAEPHLKAALKPGGPAYEYTKNLLATKYSVRF
jgi:tripartite-type tricarboxylate transporter receptor subunit TctC